MYKSYIRLVRTFTTALEEREKMIKELRDNVEVLAESHRKLMYMYEKAKRQLEN